MAHFLERVHVHRNLLTAMTRFVPFIILAILLLVGYLAYRSYAAHKALEAGLEERFVKPYMALIGAGKEKEAYHRFTSERFKKQYPLEVYLESYRRIRTEKGTIIYSGFEIEQQSKNLIDGSEVLQIGVRCTLENNAKQYYLQMAFQLAEQPDGTYLVNNSFSQNPEGFLGPW
jgi:hypothetical protein